MLSLVKIFMSGWLAVAGVMLPVTAVLAYKGPAGLARQFPHLTWNAPSTDLGIYLANLKGQLNWVQREKFISQHRSFANLTMASRLSYRLAIFYSDIAGIERALVKINQAIALRPDEASLYLTRAGYSMSLHRFEQAKLDLKRYSVRIKLVKGVDRSQALWADIFWNQGHYRQAETLIRAEALKNPNVGSLVTLAYMEHKFGNYQKANKYYLSARQQIVDTNPETMAWTLVQHGIHKLETCQLKAAEYLFGQAVAKAPDYVLAIEHLAETLSLQQKNSDAIELYFKAIELSKNPEYKVALAELYEELNQQKLAQPLIDQAKSAYSLLEARFPEAMYWHSAKFYLGSGAAPQKALHLLKQNLKVRPTTEAFVALAEAHLALNENNQARRVLKLALQKPLISQAMATLANQLLVGANDQKGLANLKPIIELCKTKTKTKTKTKNRNKGQGLQAWAH